MSAGRLATAVGLATATAACLVAGCSRGESTTARPAAADAAPPTTPTTTRAAAPLPAPACAEADCLPGFRTTTIDGAPLSTDDLRGRPTLVMFWASWCEPCISDGPTISALYEARRGKGFAMVGLSRDEADDATMRRFRDHYKLAYPIARVPDGDATFAAFGAPGDVPTFLLYGPDGHRAARFTGALPATILERELDRLVVPAAP